MTISRQVYSLSQCYVRLPYLTTCNQTSRRQPQNLQLKIPRQVFRLPSAQERRRTPTRRWRRMDKAWGGWPVRIQHQEPGWDGLLCYVMPPPHFPLCYSLGAHRHHIPRKGKPLTDQAFTQVDGDTPVHRMILLPSAGSSYVLAHKYLLPSSIQSFPS